MNGMATALNRLPVELAQDVLAHATPTAHLASALSRFFGSATEKHILVAWAHAIVFMNDDGILDRGDRATSIRAINQKYYPDTRALDSPTAWYLRRLLVGLTVSENRRSPTTGPVEWVIPCHVFRVPAVLDFIGRCRRNNGPLDDVVRSWDAPIERRGPNMYVAVPSPDLVARLAEPRLRLVPEGLQVPSLLLYDWEHDDGANFRALVVRLVDLIPTLATATAPMQLWLRLGADERHTFRNYFSAVHAADEVAENLHAPVTLPMVWALVASVEGRVAALDFLVNSEYINLRLLIGWISSEAPSRALMHAWSMIPGPGRALNVWRWLVDRGYQYPSDRCGPMLQSIGWSCDYRTTRTLFMEHDLPLIRAVVDMHDRRLQFGNLAHCVRSWVVAGQCDILSTLAELGALNPSCAFFILELMDTRANPMSPKLLLLLEACSYMDGGVMAVLDAGMEHHVDLALTIAQVVIPKETMGAFIARHSTRRGLLSALLQMPDLSDAVVDQLQAIVRHMFASTNNNPFHPHASDDAVELAMSAACDQTPGAKEAARFLSSLSLDDRVAMFASAVQTLPNLHGSRHCIPAFAPQHWPPWQYALDQLLPSSGSALTEATTSPTYTEQLIAKATGSRPATVDPWQHFDVSVATLLASSVPRPLATILAPVWAVVRLSQVAPRLVITHARWTAHAAQWLWQLRLDQMLLIPAFQPRPVPNWQSTLRSFLSHKRETAARILVQILYLESQYNKKKEYTRPLLAIGSRNPEVIEYARSAGFMLDS
ncbi:hypothetical protein BC828DRAFT_139706 [Blastocladiella britannica]|nr:hypothetical protein BC828DRAFT_139706 [Blastocladiella britannica]